MTVREESSRTAMLLGEEGLDKLRRARVLLFGAGGVGSYAAEALVRAGVGALGVCDGDVVSRSNINRQLIALRSTVGKAKTAVVRERAADIDPEVEVTEYPFFYTAETAAGIDLSSYDFIIDAIDMVTAKLLIITAAQEAGVPVISCMGTGNRLDPTAVTVTDLAKTSGCPLARVMRRELRSRGIIHLPVVCSSEAPLKPDAAYAQTDDGRVPPGSVPFVPPVAGMTAAGAAIRFIVFGQL